jgi:hypothetical protein
MVTVILILAVTALICTILSLMTPARAPLWLPVLLLCLIELLRVVPLGR